MKARTAPATTSFHGAHAEAPPSIQGAATSHAPNRTLMNRHACRQSAAASNPALRSEHGGREQRPGAKRGLSGRFHGAALHNICRNICAAGAAERVGHSQWLTFCDL
jgi:hypothetical protein